MNAPFLDLESAYLSFNEGYKGRPLCQSQPQQGQWNKFAQATTVEPFGVWNAGAFPLHAPCRTIRTEPGVTKCAMCFTT